jgi:hypothetical protein
MGIISLSFDLDKEAAGLPEGVYQFQINEAEEAESQAGNPMVNLRLAVVNDPQYNGRTVFDRLVLTAASARRLKAFGDAAGLDFRMGVDPAEMVGKIVWAEVKHEEYQGETNAKIARYRTGR